jgi:kynureninase
LSLITPTDAAARGAQLSIKFKKPLKRVFAALEAKGVICDLREPDVLRVAPAPLYNSFEDVFNFAAILRDALDSVE